MASNEEKISDHMDTSSHIAQLQTDINHFLDMTYDELFELDYEEVQKLQLQWARKRFAELKPKIKALSRLADEVEIDEISTIDDLISVSFPHTMYKSYSMKDLTKKRFDRLTRWLGTFTSVDLSQIDVSNCDSLESWLDKLEAETDVRLVNSSGTSGKISFFPRTQQEEERNFSRSLISMFDPFHGVGGADFRSGEFHMVAPVPYNKGRHNIPITFRLFLEQIYHGNEDMLIPLGRRRMTADQMLLQGRLRRAESLGEEIELTEEEEQIAMDMAEAAKSAGSIDTFLQEGIVDMAGKKVFMYGGWIGLYQIAAACKERGIRPQFHEDSFCLGGGGAKGMSFPDGWRELIDEYFPYPILQAYSMTETTASANMCSEGHLHPLPWGIPMLADPDTGEPLPRTGVVTGRMIYFDLLANSYWSGTISGDEVTVHFDGGCSCGRQGPYYINDVHRYTESRAGDDKISCAKTPDAYEKVIDFATGMLD